MLNPFLSLRRRSLFSGVCGTQAAPQRRMQMNLSLEKSNKGGGNQTETRCKVQSTNMRKFSFGSILRFKRS